MDPIQGIVLFRWVQVLHSKKILKKVFHKTLSYLVMKSIVFKTIIIFSLLTTCFSCSDFLSENPKSQYTAQNYFVDGPTLKAGVVGAYQAIINLYVVNTNTPLFLPLLGTDELGFYFSTANNSNVRNIVDKYSYTSTEGCIQELWSRYYTVIDRCNVVIDFAPTITNISEEDRNLCIAEAKFLRAWSYFQLVQFFGDVPKITTRTTSFDYTIGRSPLSEIYDLIIDDLKFASTADYLSTEIKDGHANRWSAMTLLGKVYLTMASAKRADKVAGYQAISQSTTDLYQLAYDELDSVIQYSGRDLMPVYGDVFNIENKNKNVESIWEIQFSSIEPYGTQWSKEMGLMSTGYSGTAGGWRYNSWAGQCLLKGLPSFRGYYKERDPDFKYDMRKKWNLMDSLVTFNGTTGAPVKCQSIVGTSGISASASLTDNSNANLFNKTSSTKYRWGNSWKNEMSFIYSNCPNNIIALRFADVLLMFTEADMALHSGVATDKGLMAINRIIQRARGLKTDNVTPVTEEETPDFKNYTAETLTFDQLMKERSRELCFEFWRRHDLMRTGTMEIYTATRNDESSVNSMKIYFDSDKNYLLPVPQYEIDNSRNKEGMYQNPNY